MCLIVYIEIRLFYTDTHFVDLIEDLRNMQANPLQNSALPSVDNQERVGKRMTMKRSAASSPGEVKTLKLELVSVHFFYPKSPFVDAVGEFLIIYTRDLQLGMQRLHSFPCSAMTFTRFKLQDERFLGCAKCGYGESLQLHVTSACP